MSFQTRGGGDGCFDGDGGNNPRPAMRLEEDVGVALERGAEREGPKASKRGGCGASGRWWVSGSRD